MPGAFAHIVGRDFLLNSDLIEIGMRFTALGSVCFVAGVWLARSSTPQSVNPSGGGSPSLLVVLLARRVVSASTASVPSIRIPSVSAAVEKGGAIWMLGVMLGLRAACQRGDLKRIAIWLGALMVYPILMLLLGGFLSYGSAAIIIVCSALTISTRSYWRVVVGITVFAFLSLSIFVNYFQHRDDIRDQVWGGAPLEARIDSVIDTVRDFEWLDPTNRTHLIALDQRLNQNYFVGLAAQANSARPSGLPRGRFGLGGIAVSGSARLLARKAGICRQSANRFEDDRPSAFSQQRHLAWAM